MVAALSSWHESHAAAARALRTVHALPAHVVMESYSVLTRLPAGLAVAPAAAADVLGRRFPQRALQLAQPARHGLVGRLAAAGIVGGASYDALVALEADAHEQTLLTLDTRAQATYRLLGIDFRLIGG